jgi:hypothetical protein
LGEPLRCKKIAAPFYGCGYFFALASGYSLHHAPRKRGAWFRYYPSRAGLILQFYDILFLCYRWADT